MAFSDGVTLVLSFFFFGYTLPAALLTIYLSSLRRAGRVRSTSFDSRSRERRRKEEREREKERFLLASSVWIPADLYLFLEMERFALERRKRDLFLFFFS